MSVLSGLAAKGKKTLLDKAKKESTKKAQDYVQSTAEKFINNTRFGTDKLPAEIVSNQSVIFYVKVSDDAKGLSKKVNDQISAAAKTATDTTATKPDNTNKDAQKQEDKAKLTSTGTDSLVNTLKEVGGAIVHKNNAADALKKGTTLATITLPLPNSLNESISHNWEKSNSAIATAIKSAVNGLDSSGDNAGMATMVGDALTWGMSALGNRYPVIDPGFFQNYSGTDPRSFSFSWDFVIQTEEEANKLFDIVKKFKGYSSPGIVFGNAVLESPNYWIISVQNPKLKSALNLQPAVINRVDVDYAGSGFMDMYIDGTPKYIKLSISFSEIRAVVRDDWDIQSDSNITPGDKTKF